MPQNKRAARRYVPPVYVPPPREVQAAVQQGAPKVDAAPAIAAVTNGEIDWSAVADTASLETPTTEHELELADVAAPQEEHMAKQVAEEKEVVVAKVAEAEAEVAMVAATESAEPKLVKISLPRDIRLLHKDGRTSTTYKRGIHEVSEEVASHWYVKAAGGGRI
jgi:hypothetical protein